MCRRPRPPQTAEGWQSTLYPEGDSSDHSVSLSQQKYSLLWSQPHLVFSDLHVQDDVVDELRQRLLHCALELVVFQQSVNKLENAEDEIFKTQNFAC